MTNLTLCGFRVNFFDALVLIPGSFDVVHLYSIFANIHFIQKINPSYFECYCYLFYTNTVSVPRTVLLEPILPWCPLKTSLHLDRFDNKLSVLLWSGSLGKYLQNKSMVEEICEFHLQITLCSFLPVFCRAVQLIKFKSNNKIQLELNQ